MAAYVTGRRGRPTSGGSGFGVPAESARAQMVMRIRTILGDPAVAAKIEAALRDRIRAARPDMPGALREFLADDKGSVQFALSLPKGLFHVYPDVAQPGPDAVKAPATAIGAKPAGAACSNGRQRVDVLDDVAAV